MPDEKPSTSLTLEAVARRSQETLLVDGRHTPTLIAEGNRQTIISVIDSFAAVQERRSQQMFSLGLALAQSGEVGVLHQVFFISEAWMSTADVDKPLKHPPSQDPKRKEILMIARRAFAPPASEVVIFEMKRDSKQRLIGVEPMLEQAGSEVRSPLLDAFVIGFLGSV